MHIDIQRKLEHTPWSQSHHPTAQTLSSASRGNSSFGLILHALHELLIFDFFFFLFAPFFTLRSMLGLDNRYKTARVCLARKGGESGELGGLFFNFFLLLLLID